jgi:hypothetical protein
VGVKDVYRWMGVKGVKSVKITYVVNLHNISPPIQFLGVEFIDRRPR